MELSCQTYTSTDPATHSHTEGVTHTCHINTHTHTLKKKKKTHTHTYRKMSTQTHRTKAEGFVKIKTQLNPKDEKLKKNNKYAMLEEKWERIRLSLLLLPLLSRRRQRLGCELF